MFMQKAYHCALDDTIDILEKITEKENNIDSIFEIEEFSLLKDLYSKYGTKFSLYLFYEKDPCLYNGFNLSQMTDKFKEEWRENANWLRMSFHARTKRLPDFPYGKADYETAKKDLEDVKSEIFRFAGSEVWENFTRTHYWSGSRAAVKAWRDCGIKGLFYQGGVLPEYRSLYFTESQLKRLWNKDFWYDAELGMLYITTNVMLPGKTIEEVKERLKELEERRIIEAWCDDYNVLELKEHLEEVIRWCTQHNYQPAFYEEVFRLA